jgi:hypothetical protein
MHRVHQECTCRECQVLGGLGSKQKPLFLATNRLGVRSTLLRTPSVLWRSLDLALSKEIPADRLQRGDAPAEPIGSPCGTGNGVVRFRGAWGRFRNRSISSNSARRRASKTRFPVGGRLSIELSQNCRFRHKSGIASPSINRLRNLLQHKIGS